MDVAGDYDHRKKDASLWSMLTLAFQTLGVVYGDMGTSPLYVFAYVFSKVPIESDVDILGALSLVMYTIALIPLVQYIFIVLKANDNGEGGTFALYSLICRYANVSLLPNRQQADEKISSFKLKLPTPELEWALSIKETLERRLYLKIRLLLLVLMGTSMIIGDWYSNSSSIMYVDMLLFAVKSNINHNKSCSKIFYSVKDKVNVQRSYLSHEYHQILNWIAFKFSCHIISFVV